MQGPNGTCWKGNVPLDGHDHRKGLDQLPEVRAIAPGARPKWSGTS
jgi:hypothetical protein